MSRKKPLLYDHLKSYFTALAEPFKTGVLGVTPAVLLDTSAIIDLEEVFRKERHSNALEGLRIMSGAVGGDRDLVYLVTGKVADEVSNQHRHHSINGRPMISSETCVTTIAFYWDALKNGVDCGDVTPVDDLRYNLRKLYAQHAKGKKWDRDPISQADWSLVDQALCLGWRSREQLANNINAPDGVEPQPIYQTAVLSSDSHVYNTLDLFLKSTEGMFFIPFLKPVNVRDYRLVEGKKK